MSNKTSRIKTTSKRKTYARIFAESIDDWYSDPVLSEEQELWLYEAGREHDKLLPEDNPYRVDTMVSKFLKEWNERKAQALKLVPTLSKGENRKSNLLENINLASETVTKAHDVLLTRFIIDITSALEINRADGMEYNTQENDPMGVYISLTRKHHQWQDDLYHTRYQALRIFGLAIMRKKDKLYLEEERKYAKKTPKGNTK
ncbi:MAG: hypothetical protein QM571_02380 [Micrococcaceae bacterium]